ncbi:hypothetical protein EYC80_004726 [Monilinia laxa]|nr:hypothetical protein EYC80_004726 [Monilinia laxa]
MPSIAQEDWDIAPSMDLHTSPNVNLLKRRRDVANVMDREELLEEVQMKMNSSRLTHLHSHSHPHNLYPHIHHEPERRHLVPRSKMSMNKRARVECVTAETGSRVEQVREKEKVAGSGTGIGAGGMDLRPCHICRRKPTVKKELDSFANCEGCGKRSCWVCIRECLGAWGNQMGMEGEDKGSEEEGKESWAENGTQHRGMVCSRCCVERGTEGEVLCLGCLRMEETG